MRRWWSSPPAATTCGVAVRSWVLLPTLLPVGALCRFWVDIPALARECGLPPNTPLLDCVAPPHAPGASTSYPVARAAIPPTFSVNAYRCLLLGFSTGARHFCFAAYLPGNTANPLR